MNSYINGSFGAGDGVMWSDIIGNGNQYCDGNGVGGHGSEYTYGIYGEGGGISFISGYPCCDANSSESLSIESIIHKGSPGHYSGYVFFDSFMASGSDLVPESDIGTKIGNNGDGHVRISLIEPILNNFCSSSFSRIYSLFSLLHIFIIISNK